MSIRDGASYAPKTERRAVVEPGEFCFAAAFLDHGHIAGQCNGLIDAGGTLTHVFEPDADRLAAFLGRFPEVQPVSSFDELLADDSLHLIASAAIPDQRAGIGIQVLKSGKDYFTDKSPFTDLDQLAEVRQVVEKTCRRYFVYYAERVHNEAAWHAGELIADGRIGDVLHVVNLAPHRLAAAIRPDWFFDKARYGGIITDIGSHQVEQFLTYTGCTNAAVNFASVRNHGHPEYPGLEDFGEFSLTGAYDGASGAEPTFYSRIDWYTPDGMPVWGDGRTFITGTKGTLEVRKYLDLGRRAPASLILLADADGVEEIDCLERVGFPFFGQLILDVLNRTDHAMTQDHIFRAAQISMLAQQQADGAR
ncbi:MAG: Gfo/Idh/MocA family oxidoreductase [Pseudomonadaceae bacterium]|nr:Gfo/Idh/MocA family oxidoreductase [Pseudomonadaceae bacterium]